MSKVLSLKEDSFDGSDGTRVVCWKVELDDKTNPVPCYSAEAAKLKVGEPLPDGWSVQVSKKGKDYLSVPKASKGGGFAQSWYNSEAGVRFTQERMDRRTALMQAVEHHSAVETMTALELADSMYEWLRQSGSASSDASPSTGAASGAPITDVVAAGGTSTSDPMAADPVEGVGASAAGRTDGGRHGLDTSSTARPEANEGNGDGEAPALTPVEGGGTTDGGVVLPPIQEPHDFVPGRQLASGHWLCKECGKKDNEHGSPER